MNKIINRDQKLGQVISMFPDANKIFNEIKIDYCCGGHNNLGEALKEKGLNVDSFVERLNDEYDKFIESDKDYKDWRKAEPMELIKHIVNTHHKYTFETLKEIDVLLLKILKVHFYNHGEELLKLHKLFGNLKIELEEHLIKEENVLFPLIEDYFTNKNESKRAELVKHITEIEAEHDGAGDILKEMEGLTRDFIAPNGACTTFKLTYHKLNELEKDLFVHIHKENSVLFKMI
jgi:regulator of cell morphogenesis and NO signaling